MYKNIFEGCSMARPAKFDRQQAVDIVMNEIWKNGFELSSVNALSNRLGITRPSFYNVQPGRPDIEPAMSAFSENWSGCGGQAGMGW
jgi:hypothetical protein